MRGESEGNTVDKLRRAAKVGVCGTRRTAIVLRVNAPSQAREWAVTDPGAGTRGGAFVHHGFDGHHGFHGGLGSDPSNPIGTYGYYPPAYGTRLPATGTTVPSTGRVLPERGELPGGVVRSGVLTTPWTRARYQTIARLAKRTSIRSALGCRVLSYSSRGTKEPVTDEPPPLAPSLPEHQADAFGEEQRRIDEQTGTDRVHPPSIERGDRVEGTPEMPSVGSTCTAVASRVERRDVMRA